MAGNNASLFQLVNILELVTEQKVNFSVDKTDHIRFAEFNVFIVYLSDNLCNEENAKIQLDSLKNE